MSNLSLKQVSITEGGMHIFSYQTTFDESMADYEPDPYDMAMETTV